MALWLTLILNIYHIVAFSERNFWDQNHLQQSLCNKSLLFTLKRNDFKPGRTRNTNYIYIFLIFIYLFMAVLGLRFCARASSSCGKRGPLFIAVRGPLLLRSTGSRRAGSVIVAHGPSCSVACGIFPDQGSNPCPLHWQADSQPLRHQGSP